MSNEQNRDEALQPPVRTTSELTPQEKAAIRSSAAYRNWAGPWDEEPSDRLSWESTFVANMIRARERVEMSQTELARRIRAYGVPFHQQTVQRIENGTRSPRLNEAQAIAEILFFGRWDEAIAPMDSGLLHQVLREEVERLLLYLARLEAMVSDGDDAVLSVQVEVDRYRQACKVEGVDVDAELLRRAEQAQADWQRQLEAVAGKQGRDGEHPKEA